MKSRQEIVEENIRKAYIDSELTKALEPDLAKGKRAVIGEIRNYSGYDYIKTANGWERHYSEEKQNKPEDDSSKKESKPKDLKELFSSLVDAFSKMKNVENVITYGPEKSKYESDVLESEMTIKMKTENGYFSPALKFYFDESNNRTKLFVPDYGSSSSHQANHFFEGTPNLSEISQALSKTNYSFLSKHLK